MGTVFAVSNPQFAFTTEIPPRALENVLDDGFRKRDWLDSGNKDREGLGYVPFSEYDVQLTRKMVRFLFLSLRTQSDSRSLGP